MVKQICFLAFLLLLFQSESYAQSSYNDTLFYKSGYEKVVDIIEYDQVKVKYTHVNQKGDTVLSQLPLRTLDGFVIYDESNQLVFESGIEAHERDLYLHNRAYPDSVSVSKHQLYINPFLITSLSLYGQYRYRMGSKLQHGLVLKTMYVSPILDEFNRLGNYQLGIGYEFVPYYGGIMSFGFDFCPTIGFIEFYEAPLIQLPLSLKFDFRINNWLNFSIEGGGGHLLQNGSNGAFARGAFGIVFQLPPKVQFATEYFE